MFISLRNSGASTILFNKSMDPETIIKILDYEEKNRHILEQFIESQCVESFVLPHDLVTNIHLVNEGSTYSQDKRYRIFINTTLGTYRLLYNDEVPGFFKKLLNTIYPEIMDKQIEELI